MKGVARGPRVGGSPGLLAADRGRGPKSNAPPGIDMLHALNKGRKYSYNWYKGSVLFITFLCYMAFHAARKPPSVVKSVLRGDSHKVAHHAAAATAATGHHHHLLAVAAALPSPSDSTGWAPFNGPDGQSLLGQVDLAFLGSYALGMFFAGHFGDRLDLRYFLSAGMVTSGIFTVLFGMGYLWQVHDLSYYIIVSVLAGLCQSTGWPSVVSIVANWFGKGKRGLIMGIWNAHTSVGNILGTVIAAACLSQGWGWSFVLPGLLMIVLGVVAFCFLVVQPSDVLLASPYEPVAGEEDEHDERGGGGGSLNGGGGNGGSSASFNAGGGSSSGNGGGGAEHSVRFIDAWRIPGVSSYAFCLFFSKLIAYTFLYWLPYYIKATPIEGSFLTAKEAGDLSILFDVGGVAGGVMAGHLSDKTGASALVATSFTLSSVPFLYLYRVYGHTSFFLNVALMMLTGFFVNGPYALITTAVSADLGTHESLQGNAKALATVSAIIDGMGSIGAAIGPMMTGYISQTGGFDRVFTMLYAAAVTAGLLLFRLAAKDLQMLTDRKPSKI